MLLDHGHVITVLTDREVPLEMLAISSRCIWLCYSASAFGFVVVLVLLLLVVALPVVTGVSPSRFGLYCGFYCGLESK